ncbi:hypothetical protein [Actinomadura rupiterrae]|uniref:hypothetical protein n=1 Tax=Actinomadura rupiterrae TaxID=559627 RepID=UPI0020A50058|nr:hypothetical protein [Actinomadura rupiterrae]MCP2338470.1 hypothetical protein [Actinomadura rupiterrae]
MTEQQPGDVLDEAAKLFDAVRRRVGEAVGAAASGTLPWSDEDVWADATTPEDARSRPEGKDAAPEGSEGKGVPEGRDVPEGRGADREGKQDGGRGRSEARARGAGDVWARVLAEEPHIATGAAECRNCPVCRAIALARETGPDFRRHVEEAGRSLLAAVFDVAAAYERSRPGRARTGTSGASGTRDPSGRDATDVG